MERTVILSQRETIGPDDLPAHVAAGITLGPAPSLPRQRGLAEVERAHILQTLERLGWSHTRAAEALGIGRTTLWRKLKEYGLDLSNLRRSGADA
jgi:DNA-binding NtrC family response regulator